MQESIEYKVVDNKLLVKVGNNSETWVIENISWNPQYNFYRDGEWWGWYEIYDISENGKAKPVAVFLNLKTGEKIVSNRSLTCYSSFTIFSPNGKLAIIDSVRKILVVDLKDLNNITCIYYQEISDFIDCSVNFDKDSNVVFEYMFELWSFEEKVALGNMNGFMSDDDFNKYYLEKIGSESNDFLSIDLDAHFFLKNGGEITTIEHTVINQYDPTLVTPDADSKWDDSTTFTKYLGGTFIILNEMRTISEVSTKVIPQKIVRNNVKVDETNFRNFL